MPPRHSSLLDITTSWERTECWCENKRQKQTNKNKQNKKQKVHLDEIYPLVSAFTSSHLVLVGAPGFCLSICVVYAVVDFESSFRRKKGIMQFRRKKGTTASTSVSVIQTSSEESVHTQLRCLRSLLEKSPQEQAECEQDAALFWRAADDHARGGRGMGARTCGSGCLVARVCTLKVQPIGSAPNSIVGCGEPAPPGGAQPPGLRNRDTTRREALCVEVLTLKQRMKRKPPVCASACVRRGNQ